MKEFKGRVIAPGTVTAPALVSHGGLNTLASFQKALQFGDKKATCGDQNNADLYGKAKVCIPTVFTTAPAVKKEFEKTEYAQRLKATGVILSYICPLMYMNNPLAGKMPVITCSNKLRTYTTARYYTEAQILEKITKGA